MNNLEDLLRATLTDAERTAPARYDLAERLIANTLVPTRAKPHAVTLHGRRAARRWLPPLLAAAAIVAIVTAGVVVRSALSSDTDRPIHRPTVPTVPFPKSFSPTSVFFQDARDGWALGDTCNDPGRACMALLRTTNGGATWSAMPAPPAQASTSVCAQSGDNVAGSGTKTCVDHVAFADDLHGYAWGYRTFFSTGDGGRTWQLESVRPQSLVVAGTNVLRTIAIGAANGPTVVQVKAVGAQAWTTVTPGGGGTAETSELLASGKIAYYLASHYPTGGVLFRSPDAGRTWAKVNEAPCGNAVETAYVRRAPDGAIAAICYGGANATIRVSTDGGRTFGPDRIAPGTRKTAQAQLIPEILPVSRSVFIERVGDRTPLAGNNFRRSTDGGLTWHVIGQDDVYYNSTFGWQMFDTRNGYRLTETGGVNSRVALQQTHDGGLTWVTRPFTA